MKPNLRMIFFIELFKYVNVNKFHVLIFQKKAFKIYQILMCMFLMNHHITHISSPCEYSKLASMSHLFIYTFD